MGFPRIEDLGDLLPEGAQYVDGIRWRVFKDLDGELRGVHVLVVIGDRWTMLDGAAFRALCTRILPQLDL